MPKLPRASGDKHVSAFKAAGWQVNHIEGSHYILIKDNSEVHQVIFEVKSDEIIIKPQKDEEFVEIFCSVVKKKLTKKLDIK